MAKFGNPEKKLLLTRAKLSPLLVITKKMLATMKERYYIGGSVAVVAAGTNVVTLNR